MSYYKRALETDFFDISIWVDEVSYYMDGDLCSSLYKESDRNEISLKLCDICLERYVDDIFFSIYKSQCLDNLGLHEESLKAISLNFTPEDKELYVFQCLGQCFPLSNLNKWEELFRISSEGLSLSPEDPSLNSFKAKSLYYLNRLDESEGFFNKMFSLRTIVALIIFYQK